MRHIVLVGVSAVALALGGCSMFQRGESTQSNAAPSASSQAQAAPSVAPRSQAKTAAQSSTGAAVEKSGTSASGRSAKMGADHDQVMQAQQKLQADGLYKGKVDGIMGPQTKQAVMAFQKENGLQQTGQLDQQTMAQLTTSSGSSSSTGSSTAPSGSRSSTAGSTGTSGPTSTTPSNTPPNTSGATTKSGTQQ